MSRPGRSVCLWASVLRCCQEETETNIGQYDLCSRAEGPQLEGIPLEDFPHSRPLRDQSIDVRLGGTKTASVNLSVSDIFLLSNIPLRYFLSHSYLPNLDVICIRCAVYWVCVLYRKFWKVANNETKKIGSITPNYGGSPHNRLIMRTTKRLT